MENKFEVYKNHLAYLKDTDQRLSERDYNLLTNLFVKGEMNQTEALKLLLLAFDLNYYDAIFDFGYVLLESKIFPRNTQLYLEQIKKLISENFDNANRFYSVLHHFMRHMVDYPEILMANGFQLLQDIIYSPDWTDTHTQYLRRIFEKQAALEGADTLIKIKNKLDIQLEENVGEETRSHHHP
jgi:hypothetical protein